MRLRMIVAVVVAVVLAGGVVWGQGPGRVVKYVEGPFDYPGDPLYPLGVCNGFSLLEHVIYLQTVIDRYDDSGTLVQTIVQADVIDDRIYNSEDPSKELFANPGEHQANRFLHPVFDEQGYLLEGVHYGKPVIMFTVPGYGRIFAETGMFSDNVTTGEWVNHGLNQYLDGDVAALCDYLK